MPISYFDLRSTGNRMLWIKVTVTNGTTGSWNNPTHACGTVDGSIGTHPISSSATDDTNMILQWDFQDNIVIDECKFQIETAEGSGATMGDWKWQASNDGSTWTDLTGSFTLSPGGVQTTTITALNGNTTPYRYHRIIGTGGGAINSFRAFEEFDFQCIPDNTQATSYLYPGGEGDRRALIAITANGKCTPSATVLSALHDGDTTDIYHGSNGSGGSSSDWLKFQFSAPVRITEALWIGGGPGITAKWQGSNDNSTWADIGSQFVWDISDGYWGQVQGFPAASFDFHRDTQLNGNSFAYNYYRLLWVSGDYAWNNIAEVLFRIGAGAIGPLVPPGPPALTLSCNNPPAGNVGRAYYHTFGVPTGTELVTFTLDGASSPLPAGLSLDSAGNVSGTPTTVGTYPIIIDGTDANGFTASVSCSITINPAIASGAKNYAYIG